MATSFILILENLSAVTLPSDSVTNYAYALDCCLGPASVVSDDFHQRIAWLCKKKIQELGCDTIDESLLSEPLKHHAMSRQWYSMRREKEMEVFTRIHQWRVVNELLSRDKRNPLAQLLLLAESLEAEGYASNLCMPYDFGDRPASFSPSDYSHDEALVKHIKALVQRNTYLAREELIEIADYIQTEIVEPDKTKEHLPLVSAILNTGMPCFNYPKITKGLEKATNSLSKTSTLSDIELAPAYFTLWTLTLKSSYLNRFEKTVRQCYLTLEKGKSFPNLGVDVQDPHSINSAVKFLDENRQTLWILNGRYNVDKVIENYQPVLH